MRLHTRFEEIQTFRTISNRIDLLSTTIVSLWHFAHKRHYITQEFHQSLHTHILVSINTEYREYRSCYQSLTNTFTHLVFRKSLSLKEFLHERVIVLCSSLYKSLVKFKSFIHFLGRNILTLRSTSIRSPRQFLHDENIYYLVKIRTCLYRILNLHALRTIDFLHTINDVIKIAFL